VTINIFHPGHPASYSSGTFSKADLDEKTVNLLFFGNFYKMSLSEYANGMLIMNGWTGISCTEPDRDVYFQGIALGKKYRWLRLSYNVFMYGLILSVLAFSDRRTGFPRTIEMFPGGNCLGQNAGSFFIKIMTFFLCNIRISQYCGTPGGDAPAGLSPFL